MKDAYSEAIFTYLDNSNNYKSAMEIEQFMSEFRAKALIRFWEAVKEQLKKDVEKRDKWELGYNDWTINKWGKYPRIFINLKGTKGLEIAYQDLNANVWFGSFVDEMPNSTIIANKAKNYIKGQEDLIGNFETKHDWWLLGKYAGFNFSNSNDYHLIVSEMLEPTVQKTVKNLWDLADKMEEHIRYIDENCRK